MLIDVPRVVIAAPMSGSGKSTVTTGLLAALSAGQTAQGFKVGPDYIDPGYHTAATGRISRNLDAWLTTPEQVKGTFARGVADADIAIIEGVMGLFDGYEAKTETGSTAQVAKLLGAPVVLVIDVSKMARSAGAIALGLRDYDGSLNVAGVICNKVGSDKHAAWVTEAVEEVGLPVLGCLQRDDGLQIPERHLGLHTATERGDELDAFLAHAADAMTRYIDMARLREIAASASPLTVDVSQHAIKTARVRIAVARDEAFCFYYEDNFDLLRSAGAEIVFFSALHDESLPDNIGGIYLGGGYPELYAATLADNAGMRRALGKAIMAGVPTYAECGGLMILTDGITALNGKTYPMVGVLPGESQMQPRLTMGYRTVTASTDSPLLKQGDQVRGHEFHYSDWSNRPVDLPYAYDISARRGERSRPEGVAWENLLASYVHLHFGSNPNIAQNFVEACAEWQARTVAT